MPHQYDQKTPETKLEIKHQEFAEQFKGNKPEMDRVADRIVNPTKPLSQYDQPPIQMNPNKNFIEEYNKRALKEQEQTKRQEFLDSINEKGERLEKIYNSEQFRRIHDPLNIYGKKKNFEDLAYKVYTNTLDSQIFLRVLYYPNLNSEDYRKLVDKFNEEHRIYSAKSRLSLFVTLGAGMASWWASYRYKLRWQSFLVLAVSSIALSNYPLNRWNLGSLNKKINTFADNLAQNYPEIKYQKVELVKTH